MGGQTEQDFSIPADAITDVIPSSNRLYVIDV